MERISAGSFENKWNWVSVVVIVAREMGQRAKDAAIVER
jgi:hypothetical protein